KYVFGADRRPLDSMWLQAHLITFKARSDRVARVRLETHRWHQERRRSSRLKRQAGETKKQQTEEKPVHKVTAAERAAIKNYLARLQAKPSVRFKVSKNGSVPQIEFDHPDKLIGSALLMDVLAMADGDFLNGIVDQIANASAHGQDIERGLNFMLSVIKGIEPRDQLEAMLAAQMAAVHVATMTFARDLAPVNISAFNKLTRTFAMQMEALKRYRSGAEQKVTLQQVSVAEGGQAIVGNVTQVPRENGQDKAGQGKAAQEKAVTPPPSRPDTNVVPMPSMGESKEHDPLAVRRKSNK